MKIVIDNYITAQSGFHEMSEEEQIAIIRKAHHVKTSAQAKKLHKGYLKKLKNANNGNAR